LGSEPGYQYLAAGGGLVRKKKQGMPFWLIGIWVLNVIGLLGLVFYLIFLMGDTAAHARPLSGSVELAGMPTSTATLSAAPMQGLPPTAYILPTVTPNPRSTLIVGTTPTAPSISIEVIERHQMVIGYSVLGRPLEVYRFGSGERERLIVANIHGGYEYNTADLADELINYLDEHPEVIPSDITLYILRSLNPDGYERAHNINGRANANGVDLNHNFPYLWKEDWDRDGCWSYLTLTGGGHAASEPETIALMSFISTHHFEALISYHSAAMGIFAGGLPPFKASENLAKTLSRASRTYQYPPIQTGCEYSGNLTDWASSVKGIPSVDIELRNHRDTDFEINLRVLDAFLKWTE
jgi:predicted deacylase